MTKEEIKQAITDGFSIPGWQHGTRPAEGHKYIDVFEKNIPVNHPSVGLR